MRNRKLYKSIEELIKNKKNSRENDNIQNIQTKNLTAYEKKAAIEKYCYSQMKKKKLIPKNHTSKINEIMKNFQTIETFVNVEDLIDCINEIYCDERKQKFMGKVANTDACFEGRTENGNSQFEPVFTTKKYEQLLERAHKHIESQLKQKGSDYDSSQNRMYQPSQQSQCFGSTRMVKFREQKKIEAVMNQFQNKSCNLNHSISNKEQSIFYRQIQKIDKQNNISRKHYLTENSQVPLPYKRKKTQQKHQKVPKKWNFYSQASLTDTLFYKINSEPDKADKSQEKAQGDEFSVLYNIGKVDETKEEHDSFSRNQKKREMLKLARIYLHMILENQHKNKWKTDKKKTKQPNIASKLRTSKIKQAPDSQNFQQFSPLDQLIAGHQFQDNKQNDCPGNIEIDQKQLIHKESQSSNQNEVTHKVLQGSNEAVQNCDLYNNKELRDLMKTANIKEKSQIIHKKRGSERIGESMFKKSGKNMNVLNANKMGKAKRGNKPLCSISMALKKVGNFLVNLQENQHFLKKQLSQSIEQMEKKLVEKDKNNSGFNSINRSNDFIAAIDFEEKQPEIVLWEDSEKLERVRAALEKQENVQALKQAYRKNKNI